jgi:hypothetical protein
MKRLGAKKKRRLWKKAASKRFRLEFTMLDSKKQSLIRGKELAHLGSHQDVASGLLARNCGWSATISLDNTTLET